MRFARAAASDILPVPDAKESLLRRQHAEQIVPEARGFDPGAFELCAQRDKHCAHASGGHAPAMR